MNKDLVELSHHHSFESLKQTENGSEFWSARKLAKLLEYSEYRHFLPVIEKAKEACKNSGYAIEDHIEHMLDMVEIGSGAKRSIPDLKLSRYACYLVVQNGDPSKPVIANGQTYFAIQTRRQELSDDVKFQQLAEDKKRLFLRNELCEHNKLLVETAQRAGVETPIDFATFQNHGYKGLYGGLDAKAIHQHKGLKKNQKILDHMGSTELAANLFRATQADEKLRRDQIKGKIYPSEFKNWIFCCVKAPGSSYQKRVRISNTGPVFDSSIAGAFTLAENQFLSSLGYKCESNSL